VLDVVRALAGLLDDERARGQVFNVGATEEVTILELARRVIELTGSASEVCLTTYDEAYGDGFEDMRRRVPDNSLARELIGFVPRAGIDDIVWSVASTLGDPGVARSAEWGAFRAHARAARIPIPATISSR
jgi:UDP-glucose 4-epimerase